MPSTSDCLTSIADILPDAHVVRVLFPQVVVETAASPREVFAAEVELRRRTGAMWEVMMPDMEDRNVIRVRRATKRREDPRNCQHKFTQKGSTCALCGVKA